MCSRKSSIEIDDDGSDAGAHPRERFTLCCLFEAASPLSLEKLAGLIAMWETDGLAAEIPATERKHVYLSLHYTHIPVLEGANLVEYNRMDDVVTLADDVEPADTWFRPEAIRGRQ